MTRTTLGYIAVLVLLAGLAVARLLMPTGPEPIRYKIAAVPATELRKLVLSKGSESVTLERASAEAPWLLTAPLQFQADGTAVEALVKALEKDVTMDLLVTSDPAQHEKFELLPDQALKLEIYRNGVLENALYLGKNGAGGATYLRPVNGEEVYRARFISRARIDKPARDWREKKIFDLKPDEISRLVVQEGSQVWTFVRDSDRKWAVEGDAGLKLDQNAVDSMARSFASLRAAEIVDEAPPASGLEAPGLLISATLQAGAHRLKVGGEKESGTRFVQRDDDPQLFTLRDGTLGIFRKSRDDLRDKSLLDFDVEAINGLTVARGSNRVRLEQEESGWKVLEPSTGLKDPRMLQRVMAGMTSLRVGSFVDPSQRGAAGLEKDPLVITLQRKSGDPFVLTVGGEKSSGELFATRSSDGALFTLRDYSINSFRQLIGEDVPAPPTPPGRPPGLPPGMQLPPGVQLPPGFQMPQ